jgi:hypothetical protein
VCVLRRPPAGRLSLAGGGTEVPVLSLVCLCLVLLWLQPRLVVGTPIPGLAVLFMLGLANRLGWFANPAGLRAWLHGPRLPDLAAAAGTRAGQGRCGFLPGTRPRRHNG